MGTNELHEQQLLFDPTIEKQTEQVVSVYDLTAEDVERLKTIKPKLLNIRCRRADCGNNLHCFDAPDARTGSLSPWLCACGRGNSADLEGQVRALVYLAAEPSRDRSHERSPTCKTMSAPPGEIRCGQTGAPQS